MTDILKKMGNKNTNTKDVQQRRCGRDFGGYFFLVDFFFLPLVTVSLADVAAMAEEVEDVLRELLLLWGLTLLELRDTDGTAEALLLLLLADLEFDLDVASLCSPASSSFSASAVTTTSRTGIACLHSRFDNNNRDD
jgi:hypothetical protein